MPAQCSGRRVAEDRGDKFQVVRRTLEGGGGVFEA